MIHGSAETGYSKGSDTYASGRPDYPAEIAGWLTGTMGLSAASTVLDLGAGTGKFTRFLADTSAKVIAVEPVDAMREQLHRYVPSVMALAGSANDIPLADGSVDVVICPQSFHWFATESALAEIHRVLRPSGKFGLVWNVRDEQTPWVLGLSEIMRPYETGTPRLHTGKWREPFATGLFTPLQEQSFPYSHTGAPEQVIVDRIMSVSFIAALPENERNIVRGKVKALIDAAPALTGKNEVSFPYLTTAYCCEKI